MKGDSLKQAALDRLGAFANRRWQRMAAVPVALVAFYGVVSWPEWRHEAGQAAGLGARMACSCRFIEGRPLGSCPADLSGIRWMALVRYSEDSQARRVTATVPLLASRSAVLKPGFGCLPER